MPDVVIWTAPVSHYEIKHKSATRYNTIGLERYRLTALTKFAQESHQSVYYAIHLHNRSGGRMAKDNNIQHWIVQDVFELSWLDLIGQTYTSIGGSYVGGKPKQVEIVYWSTTHFEPLEMHFSKRKNERSPSWSMRDIQSGTMVRSGSVGI